MRGVFYAVMGIAILIATPFVVSGIFYIGAIGGAFVAGIVFTGFILILLYDAITQLVLRSDDDSETEDDDP